MSQTINCSQPLNCSQAAQCYNGDIAGPGVRVSFYIQTLILVLLMERSHEETENALWTFIATSFGLTIAALVQVANQNLTLLDGILVSQLAWFSNLGIFLALASYSRSRGQDRVVKVAAVLQGYLAMILTIMMWASAKSMPPESSSENCNEPINFVFMFAVTLPALGSGRVAALVIASSTMVVYTALTFTEVWALVNRGKSRLSKETDAPDVEIGRSHKHRSTNPSHRGHHRRGSRQQGHSTHGKYQHWLPTNVGAVFFGISISQLIILAYFTITTELIISRSNGQLSDPSSWGFGQVLALTVVIPSVVALLRAIKIKFQEGTKSRTVPRLRSGSSSDAAGSGQAHATPDGLVPPSGGRVSSVSTLEVHSLLS